MLRTSQKPIKTKLNKQSKKEEKAAYLFILIPLLGFLVFTLLSTGYSVVLSFFNYNIRRHTYKFIGFENYADLFKSKLFLNACLNTVVLLFSIPVGISIGLILAVYLKKLAKGSKLLSLIYYLPAVTSAVAINLVWQYIFNYDYGLINLTLNTKIPWFDATNFWTIKIAIMFRGVWGGIGGTMVLYLAGLNNISNDFYESSSIDGASKLQQFIHITIPMTSSTTFYLLVTSIIGGLQSYADAQIFANGNENAQTIVYFIWQQIRESHDYGMASAASVLLAVVICIITIFMFKKNKTLEV